MNDEYRVFRIEDKDNLQPSVAESATYHAPFVVFSRLWIGTSCPANNGLSLFRGDAMLRNMLDIPRIPSEFHGEPRNNILLYM